MSKVALVVGATGASAKRLVEVLAAADWRVIAVSRRPSKSNPGPNAGRIIHVAADLSDAPALTKALTVHTDITHVFYTARAAHGESGVESVPENLKLLTNTVDAVTAIAPGLQHIHLVEGTKWYGMHLGAFPTPAREDQPRHLPPNFYYDQQDLLEERQRGQRWTWSASRPNFLCDFAPERPRNAPALLGAYASICRELNTPLDFPGTEACYRALADVTDASQLARAMVFLATSDLAHNRAFNVTNGDAYRWCNLWPKIAEDFGIPLGQVRTLNLATWMADKEPVWARIVKRHDLASHTLAEVALWPFGDFLWRQNHDTVSSTTRIRTIGFNDVIDTETMYRAHITSYRAAKILP
jgi:nucleoside-diphosphate-sugar epimerase